MASQTDICNLALSIIGARGTIGDINENSAEANACLIHYQVVLEQALRLAHWNFARKQINLTLLKDGTAGDLTVPSPWIYEYAYPSDCIRARFLMPIFQAADTSAGVVSAQPYYIGAPVRFCVSTDTDSGGNPIPVVLTNQNAAQLVYTFRTANTQLFDPDFVMLFSRLLAVAICMPIGGDKQLKAAAFAEAQALATAAQATNGNEGLTVIDAPAEWTRVRGYASDWAYPDGGYLYYGPQALNQVI